MQTYGSSVRNAGREVKVMKFSFILDALIYDD